MNTAIIMGRLARDPEVRYSNGEKSIAIANYTLAVDRRGKAAQNGQASADFIRIVAFDKAGEFAEKYFRQGMQVLVSGRIQTGSYTNKEGTKIPTFEIVAATQEFAQSKAENSAPSPHVSAEPDDGYLNAPDDVDNDGLPFN